MSNQVRFKCALRNHPVPPARRPSVWLFVLAGAMCATLGALLANAF